MIWMNLGAKNISATKTENEEKVPKQLIRMQSDGANDDNGERLPQLRSLSDDEVSILAWSRYQYSLAFDSTETCRT